MKHEREKVINEIMKRFNLSENDRFSVQCFVDGIYLTGKEDGKQEAIEAIRKNLTN